MDEEDEDYNENFNYNNYKYNDNDYQQQNNYNNYQYNNNSSQIYNNYNINMNNQYNDFINQQNIPTNTNKNIINKVNQLYKLLNLYDNISLYNHKNEQEKSNIRTNNIINLLLFIFSGFNIKLKENPTLNNIFNDKNTLDNNIYKFNLILKYLNSKFLIKDNLSAEEYILLTLYFIDFFDFFKNIIDFLKNKQSDSLFSWKNLYMSLNDDINNVQREFNCMDNLKKMELNESYSVLEAYNKLHFIISNIKKQLDTLINQIFKLNEIKINQSLGRYKLEELLLISDNKIFDDYKQLILYSPENVFIYKYLENIIEAIKRYPDIYDLLVKEIKNYDLSNDIINTNYISLNEEKSENDNKVNKTKLAIIQKLIELQYNLNDFDLNNFKTFFNDIQNKINYNIAEIKNKNSDIINSIEFTNMLNNVLQQLQNYISKNIIDLDNIMQSNVDIETIIKDIETAQKMFLENKTNKNIWDKYSQYLFSIKEYLEIFYKKNMITMNQILQNKEDIINKDYTILNKKK